MSKVRIEHTTGDVSVERDGEGYQVSVTFEPESEGFSLEDGDTIVTGADGYVTSVAEYAMGKYDTTIDICPQSRVNLDIGNVITGVHIERGLCRLFTNCPLDIPYLHLEYLFEQYPQFEGQDQAVLLVKVEKGQSLLGSLGVPVRVRHAGGEAFKLMPYEQVRATPDGAVHQDHLSSKLEEAFQQIQMLEEQKVNGVVSEQRLLYYRALEKSQQEMAVGLREGLSFISEEALRGYLDAHMEELRSDLDGLSPAIQKEAEPLLRQAIAQWSQIREELLKEKIRRGDSWKEKDIAEIREAIEEIKSLFPPREARRFEKRLTQYIDLLEGEEDNAPTTPTSDPAEEPSELERRLLEMDREIEAGLEELSQQIDSSDDDEDSVDEDFSDLQRRIAELE